ncbi:LysR family transcriptional regulator [Gordonia sp. PDNC005]|uniref:LysR family transcriptional regulator n=1 Tax=unclassified Gordonia (in: high G+C Gram-positive bacteria) TaxID=2657482 RepID=UPI001964C4C3|nr:LysR family transcriptional regulator [Gordonia sp. PDNC005]QRY61513.1 LysR family transcriptional regulator [Gordonia sp. PDNC005]
MEFRQLEYVAAVAETGGFSRAAQRCFVSQSAISHQVAALERELGAELFDRSQRRVRLTEAGETLLPFARDLLAMRDAAIAATAPRPERVRIAANMSFARSALAAVSAVREQHPEAEIDFLIKPFTQRIDAVASGEADLALIRGTVDRDNLYLDPLWVDQPVIAFNSRHPLAAGGQAPSPNDLAAYPLLLPPPDRQVLLHRLVQQAFTRADAEIQFGPEIREGHSVAFELVNRPEAWTVLYEDPLQPGISCRRSLSFTLPVSAVLRVDAKPNALVAELLTELSGGFRRT